MAPNAVAILVYGEHHHERRGSFLPLAQPQESDDMTQDQINELKAHITEQLAPIARLAALMIPQAEHEAGRFAAYLAEKAKDAPEGPADSGQGAAHPAAPKADGTKA